MSATKRLKINLGSFDFIKGIAIISVILFHGTSSDDIAQPGAFSLFVRFLWLTRYAIIPLFFLISGFGFKPKPANIMLKKSFSESVVPHLWITLAVAIVYPFVNYPAFDSWQTSFYHMAGFVSSMLLGYVGGVFSFNADAYWCSVTWYLLATFVAHNCLNLILKFRSVFSQILCSVLCIVLGNTLFNLDFKYFCIPQGLIAVGYCYIGYAIKTFNLFERIYHSFWTYFILIPLAYVENKWGYFDLCPGIFSNLFLDYIGAGCFALLLMLIGFRLGQLDWKYIDWVKQIGVYTYWILCIHSFEIVAMPWRLLTGWIGIPSLMFFSDMLLKSSFIFIVCMLLKKYMKFKYQRRFNADGQRQLHQKDAFPAH